MRALRSITFCGGFLSSSWLKDGMPSRSKTSSMTPGGSSAIAARSAARLWDCTRKLPAMPRILMGSGMDRFSYGRQGSSQNHAANPSRERTFFAAKALDRHRSPQMQRTFSDAGLLLARITMAALFIPGGLHKLMDLASFTGSLQKQ